MGWVIAFNIVVIVSVVVYSSYDPYYELKKNFSRETNTSLDTKESFEYEKHNFNIYGISNTGKTQVMRNFYSIYKAVHVFCEHEDEWKGYNTLRREVYLN